MEETTYEFKVKVKSGPDESEDIKADIEAALEQYDLQAEVELVEATGTPDAEG